MRYPDEVRLESFIDGRDGWSDLILRRKKKRRGTGFYFAAGSHIPFSCIPEKKRKRLQDTSVGRDEKIKSQ